MTVVADMQTKLFTASKYLQLDTNKPS